MVKKIQKSGSTPSPTQGASPLAAAIKDSAQQIWLAGLGAFSKAQAEGGKAFDTLVKEGMSIQRKTQAVAEERISEASDRVTGMATDISSKAAGQWDKLENIFEDRVAKALNKLGVPSARDVQALLERIDGLSRQVQALGHAPAVAPKAPTRKTAARPPAAAKKPVKATRKTATSQAGTAEAAEAAEAIEAVVAATAAPAQTKRKPAARKAASEAPAPAAPAKATRKTASRKTATPAA